MNYLKLFSLILLVLPAISNAKEVKKSSLCKFTYSDTEKDLKTNSVTRIYSFTEQTNSTVIQKYDDNGILISAVLDSSRQRVSNDSDGEKNSTWNNSSRSISTTTFSDETLPDGSIIETQHVHYILSAFNKGEKLTDESGKEVDSIVRDFVSKIHYKIINDSTTHYFATDEREEFDMTDTSKTNEDGSITSVSKITHPYKEKIAPDREITITDETNECTSKIISE